MSTVALIIIYNHQYNKNIPILENLYGKRFSHIYHLVPFYSGDQENVIPVYSSSYYFQGYVAQGLKSFFKKEFTHYFFIADDMIVNPAINENNYATELGLEKDSCYISRLSPMQEAGTFWPVNVLALFYNKLSPGTEAENQLPDIEEATTHLRRFGISNSGLPFEHIWQIPQTFPNWISAIVTRPVFVVRYLKAKLSGRKYIIPYPLARSYSDIFVVSADAIKMFCHYCGVFAATNLFVELAVPTAMVFAAKKIVTEKDISFKGRALWTKDDLGYLDRFQGNISKLMEEFPAEYLYLHPVKLSKWKI